MTLDEWSKVATIVGAVGVLALGIQLYIAYRQVKADHERSRRERSVEVLMEWSKNLKKEGSVARKIIECLNEEQCKEVFSQQTVKISKKHEGILAQFFGQELVASQDGESIELTEAQSTELRWHAITYLNSLEFTLVAWQYSVVDREIIESQFSYLFRPAGGHEVLKYFRRAAGGEESYPAITVFAAHLSRKQSDKLISKANII
jgi:hypothetical protein